MKKKLKEKARRSRAARSPPRNQSPEVSLKFGSLLVLNRLVVRSKRGQDLKDAIAYYRRELEGNPNAVFSLRGEDACSLMADAIALHLSVDGFEMVLRYSEDLGWHCHSLLPT